MADLEEATTDVQTTHTNERNCPGVDTLPSDEESTRATCSSKPTVAVQNVIEENETATTFEGDGHGCNREKQARQDGAEDVGRDSQERSEKSKTLEDRSNKQSGHRGRRGKHDEDNRKSREGGRREKKRKVPPH